MPAKTKNKWIPGNYKGDLNQKQMSRRYDNERERENRKADAGMQRKTEQYREIAESAAQKVVEGAIEKVTALEAKTISDKFQAKHYFIKALEDKGHGPETFAEQMDILKKLAAEGGEDFHVTKGGDIVTTPVKADTRIRAATGYMDQLKDIHGLKAGSEKDNVVIINAYFDRDYDGPDHNTKPIKIISETTGADEQSPDC